MKKLMFILTVLIALGPGCVSTRVPKPLFNKPVIKKDRIVKEVEAIINSTDPNVNIGVKIASLNSDEVVFEKNAERHFVPASTTKLLTLAAALYYLGPSYRFTTALLTDGFLKHKGSIKNLYIKGSGDPSLMDRDLTVLVSELKQMGIKEITGHLYIDDQIFDDVLWGRGAMWDDRNRGFGAPVSGLNLNYNRLVLKTVPAFEIGKVAPVIVQPFSHFVEVVSKAKTVKSGNQKLSLTVVRGQHRETHWPSTTNDGAHLGDKIYVEGQTTASSGPNYQLVAVNDPGSLAGAFLKDQLAHAGIHIHGTVSRKTAPASAIVLAKHESRSLAEALIDFTKISNNIANDALVKTIAAEAGAKPASLSQGLALINEFLKKEVGIDPNSLVTADGAGLSRYNLITPQQMVKLLKYAANHFHMAPEFMAALPIGGQDGNLYRRLTADHLRGNVRAKTGSETGISSLVGYLTGVDGNRYAFAIMINGFIGSTYKYTRMQDEILATMLKEEPAQTVVTAK